MEANQSKEQKHPLNECCTLLDNMSEYHVFMSFRYRTIIHNAI